MSVPRTAQFFDATTAGYPYCRGVARFGEWLVRRGAIDRAELFTALDVSFRHGCRLGDAVVWLELLSRSRVEQEARRHQACAARPRAPRVDNRGEGTATLRETACPHLAPSSPP